MSSRRQETYQKVLAAIVNGTLRPGERLIEQRICEEFKVSRTPLREVLRQLEAEGHVEVIPNKGAVVRKMSLKEVADFYDMIALLEAYATEIATPHVKPEDKKRLLEIHNGCKEAARSNNYKKWLEHNAFFHGYFHKLCGNVYLCSQIDSLRMRNYRYRLIALTIPRPLDKYLDAHQEILRSVFKKDAKQAGGAMRRHQLDVKKTLLDVLKEYPEL